MKKKCIGFVAVLLISSATIFSQNLLTNPGAESLPAGTGWTIISTGGAVCASGTAAATYNNWTMVPDGSANYPAAHGGTHTFFAGCNGTAPASFELRQDIDVTGDATQIDANNVNYVFSGYIQTPIAAQSDAGRFTIDYLDAVGTVLGTSYTVSQSGLGGSGNAWNFYTNTRQAPVGTRTVRVRLITNINTTPAINAYFDDLSLVRAYISTLPVTLISFTATDSASHSVLKWKVDNAVNFDRFEIQRSENNINFTPISTIAFSAGQTDYYLQDPELINYSRLFYRLKMIDIDGRSVYSNVNLVNREANNFRVLTNNAAGNIMITGLSGKGIISISDINGKKVFQQTVNSSFLVVNVTGFAKGLYIVSWLDSRSNFSATNKFVIN